MSAKLYGLVGGIGIGFVFAWAGLSDPAVIRDMLLLRDPHVFLLMGSTMVVAALGVRLLRARGAKTWVSSARSPGRPNNLSPAHLGKYAVRHRLEPCRNLPGTRCSDDRTGTA